MAIPDRYSKNDCKNDSPLDHRTAPAEPQETLPFSSDACNSTLVALDSFHFRNVLLPITPIAGDSIVDKRIYDFASSAGQIGYNTRHS
jgi:hypothetical protein